MTFAQVGCQAHVRGLAPGGARRVAGLTGVCAPLSVRIVALRIVDDPEGA